MANGSGSNATLILVLGILGIVCCGFLAPVAWYMGNNALRDIDAGIGNPADRGLVVAGRILGIIGTVLLVVSFCVGIILGLTGALAETAQQGF